MGTRGIVDFTILLLTDNAFAQQASIDLQDLGYQTIAEKAQKGWSKLSTHHPRYDRHRPWINWETRF